MDEEPESGHLGIIETVCTINTHELLMPDDRGLHCPRCGAFL